MGLDAIEIILRTEETFAIDLPDDERGQIRTVGDLYRLILTKLDLPYTSANDIGSSGRDHSAAGRRVPHSWQSHRHEWAIAQQREPLIIQTEERPC